MKILGTMKKRRLRHYIVDNGGWVEMACTSDKFAQLVRYQVEQGKHATCLWCIHETR